MKRPTIQKRRVAIDSTACWFPLGTVVTIEGRLKGGGGVLTGQTWHGRTMTIPHSPKDYRAFLYLSNPL